MGGPESFQAIKTHLIKALSQSLLPWGEWRRRGAEKKTFPERKKQVAVVRVLFFPFLPLLTCSLHPLTALGSERRY